jgi:hypothetical protein
MYGVVAASLMLVATISVAAFYSLDLAPHLPALAALALLAFVAGLLIRLVQTSRHRRAHLAEYDRIGPSDFPQPGESS